MMRSKILEWDLQCKLTADCRLLSASNGMRTLENLSSSNQLGKVPLAARKLDVDMCDDMWRLCPFLLASHLHGWGTYEWLDYTTDRHVIGDRIGSVDCGRGRDDCLLYARVSSCIRRNLRSYWDEEQIYRGFDRYQMLFVSMTIMNRDKTRRVIYDCGLWLGQSTFFCRRRIQSYKILQILTFYNQRSHVRWNLA